MKKYLKKMLGYLSSTLLNVNSLANNIGFVIQLHGKIYTTLPCSFVDEKVDFVILSNVLDRFNISFSITQSKIVLTKKDIQKMG